MPFSSILRVMRWLILIVPVVLVFGCKNPKSEKGNSAERIFNEDLIFNPAMDAKRDSAWRFLARGQMDSAIMFAQEEMQEAESKKAPPEVIINNYSHFAELLFNINAYDLGEEYTIKAQSVYSTYFKDQPSWTYHTFASQQALFDLAKKNYDEAINHYHQSIERLKPLNKDLFVASMMNNIGVVYLEQDNLDSAKAYFQKARLYYMDHKLPFDGLFFSINNNLADLSYQLGNYHDSYNLYDSNYQLARMTLGSFVHAPRRIVTSNIGRAKNDLELNKADSARAHVALAEAYLDSVDYRKRLEYREEILELKGRLAVQRLDISDYKKFNLFRMQLRDSINEIKLSGLELANQKVAELQIQAAQLQLAAGRQVLRFNRLLGISIVSIIVMIAIFIVMVIRRRNKALQVQRQLAIVELENKELQEEKLRLELSNKMSDLNELSAHAAMLKKFTQQTKDQLKDLWKFDKDEQKTKLRELSSSLNQNDSQMKVNSLIQENLHDLNTAFFVRLDEISNNQLTKKEKELCALFRLMLSNDQIADLRNTSINAVWVARHRIKNKLNLGKEDSLSDFLRKLE
ncbi:MAG: tetratricopeptide repeat protein [Bacteroidetes bacterium]|nr:tetratricopeptide repeat protein [Bacteroidota bacterium]